MTRDFNLDDYIDVAERLREFAYKHPSGSLQTKVIAWPTAELPFLAVEARAYRTADDERPGVGLAWEPFPGRTPYTKDSELQNAETGAWGRALVAVLAADTKRGIATKQDVRNRRNVSPKVGEQPVPDALGEGAKGTGGTSDAGESRGEVEGELPVPAEYPAPGDVPASGTSDHAAAGAAPDPSTEVSARGASKPVCSVNGALHKPDPERSLRARKGFVVCLCGDAKPVAESSGEWAA